MSWRTVVISSNAKQDYQLGYLVVRKTEVTKIHLSEIYLLMIESTSVSLTTALLCELMKRKIKVIFCDEKRNLCSVLLPYYGSRDTSNKVKKQMVWDEDVKKIVWTKIVEEKIFNQEMVLSKYDLKEKSLLEKYRYELEFGDATNREGHALNSESI